MQVMLALRINKEIKVIVALRINKNASDTGIKIYAWNMRIQVHASEFTFTTKNIFFN